jgi:hypothetical protein
VTYIRARVYVDAPSRHKLYRELVFGRCPNLARPGGLTGTVNLTIPLATLLELADSPGELGGFGPVTVHTAREMTSAALDSTAVRWCVTVTGGSSEAVGHGCASRSRPAQGDPGKNWAFTVKLNALATVDCGHRADVLTVLDGVLVERAHLRKAELPVQRN